MAGQTVRVVLALLGAALLALGAYAEYVGIWLLTTDDPDGGAHAFGLFVFPGAVVVGIIALGLLTLAIRPRSVARAFRGRR